MNFSVRCPYAISSLICPSCVTQQVRGPRGPALRPCHWRSCDERNLAFVRNYSMSTPGKNRVWGTKSKIVAVHSRLRLRTALRVPHRLGRAPHINEYAGLCDMYQVNAAKQFMISRCQGSFSEYVDASARGVRYAETGRGETAGESLPLFAVDHGEKVWKGLTCRARVLLQRPGGLTGLDLGHRRPMRSGRRCSRVLPRPEGRDDTISRISAAAQVNMVMP